MIDPRRVTDDDLLMVLRTISDLKRHADKLTRAVEEIRPPILVEGQKVILTGVQAAYLDRELKLIQLRAVVLGDIFPETKIPRPRRK
jgi:hypothetical protein